MSFWNNIKWLFRSPERPVGPALAQVGVACKYEVADHTDWHPYRFLFETGTKGTPDFVQVKTPYQSDDATETFTFDRAGEWRVIAQQRCPFKFWTSGKSKPLVVTVVSADIRTGCGGAS